MGTNYYAVVDFCEVCKRGEFEVHLGKFSFGWKFLFRQQSNYYNDFESFCKFLRQGNIIVKTEYGEVKEKERFISSIEESYRDKTQKDHEPYSDEIIKDSGIIKIGGYTFCERDFS